MMKRFFQEHAKDLHLSKPPFWMLAAVIVLVVLTWVPLAIIARARVTRSSRPRVHLFQDMDEQPKFQAQGYRPIFADDRAMRGPVPGTVARGNLRADDHYYRGYRVTGTDDQGNPTVEYFAGVPEQVRVTAAFMQRGREMYNVYCFTCHGLSGKGNGPTDQRATRLMGNPRASMGTQWVHPADLTAREDGQLKYGPELVPDGELFNIITNGFNNMPAYGDQIQVDDRWAIVTYVRALQVSQSAADAEPSAGNGAAP